MESDLQHHHHHHQNYHQKPMNSGLTRYQSAPSSYFSGIFDRDFCEEFLNRPSSPETERFFTRFLANSGGNSEQNLRQVKQDSPVREATQANNNQKMMHHQQQQHQQQQQQQQLQQQQQQSNYSASQQSYYQNQSRPPIPDQNYLKSGGVNNTNLVRHSSSPAGLFANINIEFENGYAVMKGMGDFGGGNREESYSTAGRPPSSGRMSPIAEIGNKNMGDNSPDNAGFGETRSSNYVTGFPVGSWDDSSMMSAGVKGLTEDDRSLSGLNASESQSGQAGNRPPMLSHHWSLPKTSAEMSALEKFLQLQDSVPCKARAKRGCATHPRSIAERMRRTRISERMRKLQDLVPNMDKQTNTADMLDLAVDYIKDLERQVKALSENRAKCTCPSDHHQS